MAPAQPARDTFKELGILSGGPDKGITHVVRERLEFTQLALLVASFQLCKHGFVIGLTRGYEVIKDTVELVSGIFYRFGCTMPSALRAVVVAQIRLTIVERLSRHTKSLSDAIFGFYPGATNAASGAGTVFGAEVKPRRKRVLGWKLAR